MNKVYTNNNFTGYYPVGTAAVVSAETQQQAADKLNDALEAVGLKPRVESADMVLFDASVDVVILCDGNY